MDFESDLLRVTDLIYQGPLETNGWPVALAALGDLVKASHVTLYTNKSSQAVMPFFAATGLNADDLVRFSSPEADRLLKPFQAMIPSGVAIAQQQLIVDRDLERSEIYNELVRPTNTFYSSVCQQDVADLSFFFQACRHRRWGELAPDETRLVQELVPHVTGAMLLQHRLRLAEQHAAGLATVIERLDQGAIVTDAEGRLLIVNARAAQILERGDGLSSINGELRASTHALTEQLKSSITTMAADLAGGDGIVSLPRVSSRLPLVLTLMPIWRLGASPPGRRAPRVVIFVKEPDAPVHVDRSQLADTFGLTPRECDVALSLADEMDLGAVSAALDLKIGTTRVLLKRVFEKTGVHSQAALVTLVRSLGR